jgi:hemoglobin
MRGSVYDAVGGGPAFLRLAQAHHERCIADAELNHAFSHGTKPDHVERLAAYWAEILGGPADYTAKYATQYEALATHAGEGVPPEWADRFLACFLGALDDAGISDDPHLRQVLHDYMRWAADDFVSYGQRGAVVPRVVGMPQWSWDGLVSSG